MYEFGERVRYSETTESGSCSILALVNWLQDCSTFHSEDAGVGVAYLKARHQAWLLSYWDIYIDRMPRLCERIVVGTCPHALKGIMAYRNFWIRAEAAPDGQGPAAETAASRQMRCADAESETGSAAVSPAASSEKPAAFGNPLQVSGKAAPDYLVRAESVWFNLNLDTGKPNRIEQYMVTPYGEIRDVLGLPASSRKIALPEKLEAREPVLIQHHHIDSNHHVNNAQYIAIAAEAACAGFSPGRIRAEYRMAAVLGDEMVPWTGRTADGIAVSLKNKNGETYANVEFR